MLAPHKGRDGGEGVPEEVGEEGEGVGEGERPALVPKALAEEQLQGGTVQGGEGAGGVHWNKI